jgi:acetylornithine deacetylase/succinyl-diaminopimelate desuccinylase-like protein
VQDVKALMPQAIEDLARLVSFRSVADPAQAPPEECRKAGEFVIEAASAAGVRDCRFVATGDDYPAVFGHTPAPPGAPTVLLYCHHDVQPPLDADAWESPPFELTERGGRLYGRGAADCKGNVVMHLTALRALGGGGFPVGIKFISEGAEEQGTTGLERLVAEDADLLRADAILIADAGNAAVGVPTFTTTLRGVVEVVVTVSTLRGPVHSGSYGGPAPDALAALIRMLDSLRDADGMVAIDGLDSTSTWDGLQYDPDTFRADAGVLDGVDLIGGGTVSDLLWARCTVTVLGIDCPPVVGSSASIPATARARVSLRVAPGFDVEDATAKLIAHLKAHAPWNARVETVVEGSGAPFTGSTDGPAFATMARAMAESYGREVTTQGHGASIPLCPILAEAYPEAEVLLYGVEEPECLIHAPNESVDPSEIERIAHAEALFLRDYARAR